MINQPVTQVKASNVTFGTWTPVETKEITFQKQPWGAYTASGYLETPPDIKGLSVSVCTDNEYTGHLNTFSAKVVVFLDGPDPGSQGHIESASCSGYYSAFYNAHFRYTCAASVTNWEESYYEFIIEYQSLDGKESLERHLAEGGFSEIKATVQISYFQ